MCWWKCAYSTRIGLYSFYINGDFPPFWFSVCSWLCAYSGCWQLAQSSWNKPCWRSDSCIRCLKLAYVFIFSQCCWARGIRCELPMFDDQLRICTIRQIRVCRRQRPVVAAASIIMFRQQISETCSFSGDDHPQTELVLHIRRCRRY